MNELYSMKFELDHHSDVILNYHEWYFNDLIKLKPKLVLFCKGETIYCKNKDGSLDESRRV